MQDERDSLDALIDDTARELSAGSPSAALRDNVRARLPGGLKASGYRWRHAWSQIPVWQPALGAAAVAVLAVVYMLPAERQGPGTSPVPVAGGLPASAGGSGEAGRSVSRRPQPSGMEPLVEAEARSGSTEGSGRVDRRASSAQVAGGLQPSESNQVAVPADPLPPIEPLEVDVQPIELAVIERIPDPMPLRIDRMQIERLSLD